MTFPMYKPQEVRRVRTSALLTEAQSLLDTSTMSTFIIIIFLSLMMGKSGGSIRPVVTFTPNWGNILQGDDVTLTCELPSSVPWKPQTYQWYKDGETIHGDKQILRIDSSAERDRGDYQCRINTSDISDPVNLNVTDRHVLLQRRPSAIYEGDPLTLRCHHNKDFIGFQTRFYKNNEEIKSEFPDSEFRIQKVDLNTSGHYKCSKEITSPGRSEYHELSDEFSLSVKELFSPPKIKITSDWVIEGDEMMVRCDTRLDPLRGGTELHFAFYRDGRTVRGYNVSDTYRVQSSQLEDSGNYTCEVKTVSDTVRKMSDGLYIQIYKLFSPPEIKVTPSRVIEGDEMTVRCDTRLDPLRGGTELHFAFYRDGRTVRGYNVSDTYRVRSSQLEDSGNYTCEVRTASDTVRKMSDGFYIQIYGRVILQRPPSAIYEGDSLTLRCHHHRRLYNAKNTKFYKDDQEIKSSETDSTFHIPNITMSQSGLYKCTKQIQRSRVQEHSDVSFISVKEIFSPPEIKVTPSRIIEGDEMTVRCDTRLDPLRGGTELHFAFYRDGRTVRGYNVSDTYRVRDGRTVRGYNVSDTYRVRSSQLEDSGNYTCEVRTVSDTVRKMSDGLYIQIHELFSPPEIKVTPSRVIEGDEMTVRCDTRLDPLRGGTELQFAFYRDGRTVRGYNVSDTYRVRSSQLEDSGKYTCEVRTRSDTVWKMSDGFYIQIHDYTVQNIIRLVISGFVLSAAVCFIYFHNK
ncbi:Fc receptor-like protein 5 [Aquarana catesbeiana]|uniref:Fc receptor-like protein 5 n=1 Tax=Aquarana catesbeiana TaxID=8400 RepID=UPI003CC9FD45